VLYGIFARHQPKGHFSLTPGLDTWDTPQCCQPRIFLSSSALLDAPGMTAIVLTRTDTMPGYNHELDEVHTPSRYFCFPTILPLGGPLCFLFLLRTKSCFLSLHSFVLKCSLSEV